MLRPPMAMLTPEEDEIVKTYFRRFHDTIQPCPICGTRKWLGNGIVSAMATSAAPGDLAQRITNFGLVLPMLVLGCAVCGFVRLAIWKSVMDAVGKPHG